MRDVSADSSAPSPARHTLSLFHVLLVAGTTAFVAVLILSTGQLSPAWLLFLVPIVLGALFADVPGAVLTAALATSAAVLVGPPETLSADWPELITGLAVFTASGVVIGVQAHRQRRHTAALEAVSAVDPLTGVRKAESFHARLSEEMRRSDRYGTDVGLVVARVEGIAEFVTTFGRYKADLMLEHLANVVRLQVRDTDTVGRIAAETFAVVMPHADRASATEVAERISRAVADAEFEGDALEPVTRCTVTTASSSYPEDAGTASGLIAITIGQLAEPAKAGDGDASAAPVGTVPCDA